MADYKVILLHESDYKTTAWSGGMTTELSIAPEGSIYADRDFQWRLSSATVDLEESDFTSLPDYNRIIMTLKGGVRLSHNKGEWLELPEFAPHFFDGGDETSSIGKVIDFNLMMQKGVCTGDAAACILKNGTSCDLGGLLKGGLKTYELALIYCYAGTMTVRAEDGQVYSLSTGASMKVSGDLTNACWNAEAQSDVSAVITAVHYC